MSKRFGMSVRAWVFASLAAADLSGCATSPMTSTVKHALDVRLVVERYLAALNRRDLTALSAYVTPDIEWYSAVAADRMLEVSGRDALTQALGKYFSEHDKTHWELQRADVVDEFVAAVERSE